MSLNFPTVVTPRGQVHYKSENDVKWLMEVWCGKAPPPIQVNITVGTPSMDAMMAAIGAALREPSRNRY